MIKTRFESVKEKIIESDCFWASIPICTTILLIKYFKNKEKKNAKNISN